MGFLSNRQDEAQLRRPVHRRAIVDAIKDAIDDYFKGIRSSAPRA
jgi:N-acetylmuramoyl-L-alanine amidase